MARDKQLGENLEELSRSIRDQLGHLDFIRMAKVSKATKEKTHPDGMPGWWQWIGRLADMYEKPKLKGEHQHDYYIPRDENVQAKYLELLDACEAYHQKELDSLKFKLQMMLHLT
mgnify:CR=1 FL=1